jgi:hypothetical protein
LRTLNSVGAVILFIVVSLIFAGFISRGPGFDFGRYQIFWPVVGLERGTLSLVSITDELFERKSSCSSLESREYGRRDPSRWPRGTLYPQKLEVTSPTSGGRSIGIVRSRVQATEFFYMLCIIIIIIIIIIIAILQPFLMGLESFFSLLILHTVGRADWTGISPSQSLYLHKEHKGNKRTQTSMPQIGFEFTTPVFEWAKIAHA